VLTQGKEKTQKQPKIMLVLRRIKICQQAYVIIVTKIRNLTN